MRHGPFGDFVEREIGDCEVVADLVCGVLEERRHANSRRVEEDAFDLALRGDLGKGLAEFGQVGDVEGVRCDVEGFGGEVVEQGLFGFRHGFGAAGDEDDGGEALGGEVVGYAVAYAWAGADDEEDVVCGCHCCFRG